MASDDDLVELRGMSHRAVIAFIDGFAIAKRQNRMQVVNRILLNWAREQAHIQSVMANTTRGNPPLPDTGWNELE